MAEVSLTLLVLKTRQVEHLRHFYQALGVELAEEQHGKGPVHFVGRAGGVVIEIYPLPDDGIPVDAATRLGFAVENLAEVVQTLQGIDQRRFCRTISPACVLPEQGCTCDPGWVQ